MAPRRIAEEENHRRTLRLSSSVFVSASRFSRSFFKLITCENKKLVVRIHDRPHLRYDSICRFFERPYGDMIRKTSSPDRSYRRSSESSRRS
ncbi:hypothetical protein RvY_05350, partial [Ramazzottius varieornatus]